MIETARGGKTRMMNSTAVTITTVICMTLYLISKNNKKN